MTQLGRPSSADRGLQKIHILCLTGDWASLRKLLPDKNVIEARTADGMTPLMLAVLMGHVEVVGVLRQHHASLEAADKFGHTALMYSIDSGFNDVRRRSFSHYFNEKDLDGASLRRLVIAPMLSPYKPEAKPYTPDASGPEFIRICSNGIEAYQSLGFVRTFGRAPKTDSAVGYINSHDDPDPKAWAIPGWSKGDNVTSSKLLDGERWTKAALLRVAPMIGFLFKPHLLDQGWSSGQLSAAKRGRWFASHVECKLAVWHCATTLAFIKSTPEASMTFLAKHLSHLQNSNIGHARHVRINITLPPCESCARFLQALTSVTGITFEVVYRRSLALIPETVKNRNFKLAHEVNLDKPLEDNGSDADWDEAEEDDRMEPRMFPEGYTTASEEILEGMEEYQVLGPRFRPDHEENNDTEAPDGVDEEEEDELIVEDYGDDAFDGTYRGISTHQQSSLEQDQDQQQRDLMTLISHSRDPTTSPATESSSADVVLGTPVSSQPPSPASRETFVLKTAPGSMEDPIEVPESPSEMASARREQRKNGDEPSWSHQYQQKLRDGERRGALKIKRETQERSLRTVPKRQRTASATSGTKRSISQPLMSSQDQSTRPDEEVAASLVEDSPYLGIHPTILEAFGIPASVSSPPIQTMDFPSSPTVSASPQTDGLIKVPQPSFATLLESFRHTPDRTRPEMDGELQSPYSESYFAPPKSP